MFLYALVSLGSAITEQRRDGSCRGDDPLGGYGGLPASHTGAGKSGNGLRGQIRGLLGYQENTGPADGRARTVE